MPKQYGEHFHFSEGQLLFGKTTNLTPARQDLKFKSLAPDESITKIYAFLCVDAKRARPIVPSKNQSKLTLPLLQHQKHLHAPRLTARNNPRSA